MPLFLAMRGWTAGKCCITATFDPRKSKAVAKNSAEVTSDLTVRMSHIRGCKLCASGVRVWWTQHDFDWTDFLVNGISAARLLATGDPYARQVVDFALRETVDVR